MKAIKLNGKVLKIGSAEQRVLVTLFTSNWAAKKGAFVEGKTPRHQNTILPRESARRHLLGIREVWKDRAESRREKRFFAANPRCQTGIFGDPRRITAILNKIGVSG